MRSLGGIMKIFSRPVFRPFRKAWQDEIDLLVKTIYEINQPVKHQVELVKVD